MGYAAGVSSLEAAARQLIANPSDLDAWLEVAAGLVAAGDDDRANVAFAELGRAASSTGRVALAVACARFLAGRDAARASVLVDAIVATHAAGSAGLDEAARPPAPPARAEPAASRALERTAALALAADAVTAAAAAVAGPGKVPPTPLVSSLAPAELRALIGAMTVRAFRAGQVVIETGEPATALYWLARGRAVVGRDRKELGELTAGAFFGEIALVSGSSRTARVTVRTDALALEIPTEAVERAAAAEPRVAEVLAQHARGRLLSNLMRTSEVFTALSPADRATLLARFSPTMVAAGKTIIEAGKDNAWLWLLVSGRCSVRAPGGPIEVGPGAVLGEISLVTRKPAGADVVTIDPCTMLRLPRRDFDQVAAGHPQVLAELYKLVVAREEANAAEIHDVAEVVV